MINSRLQNGIESLRHMFSIIEGRRLYRVLFLIFVLALLFGGSIAGHIKNSASPYILNDDARQQIVPFYTISDGFKADFATSYFMDGIMPRAYVALYSMVSKFFDPEQFSKVLAYICFIIFISFVYRLTFQYSNYYSALIAVLLLFFSEYFFSRMSGGMARGFAFPLIAAGLYYLSCSRYKALLAVIFLSGCFYPMAGLFLFVCMGVYMLFSGRLVSVKPNLIVNFHSFFIMVLAGVLFSAAVLPSLFTRTDNGDRIARSDVAEFPEAGEGGRYDFVDSYRTSLLFSVSFDILSSFSAAIAAGRSNKALSSVENISALFQKALFYVLLIYSLRLLFVGKFPKPAQRLFASVLATAAICYVAAVILAPHLYMPVRYIQYSIPLLVVLLIAFSAEIIDKEFGSGLKVKRPFSLCILVLIFLGPLHLKPLTGFAVDESSRRNTYDFISTLPEGVIAGWPSALIENVPYISRRNVYYTYENHQVFHKDYALEMRRRMEVILGIYLAEDISQVKSLMQANGIKYLVVEPSLFEKGLSYFRPYDAKIKAAYEAGVQPILPLLAKSSVFENEDMFILDADKPW